MTVREIQGHLQDLYRIEVSPNLISRVTDAVFEEVRNDRTGRSIPFTRSPSSMRCGSKSRDDGLASTQVVEIRERRAGATVGESGAGAPQC